MAQREVSLQSGGVARWGRQLPLRGELKTVCYEADLMSKLTVAGSESPRYFRTTFIGMDDVEADGAVPRGFGTVRFEDTRTDDLLIGRVDWFIEDGRDAGIFSFEEGTGAWKGVSGNVRVRLEFCTTRRGDSLTSGDPVSVMGFLDGTGTLTFPD
jgi:hypothetical protein